MSVHHQPVDAAAACNLLTNSQRFEQEASWQATMVFLGQISRQGLLTDEEKTAIIGYLSEEYQPVYVIPNSA